MTGDGRRLSGKRVLFVLDSLHLGGSERQALYLARHLKESCGARVDVAGIAGTPGRGADLCRELGIPWHIIPFAIAPLPPLTMLKMALVARRLRRLAPEIILPFTAVPNILCGTVWQATGARFCVWNQRDEGLGLKGKFLTRGAARNTPCFVSNSSAGSEFLRRVLQVEPSRIKLVRNGVPLPEPRLSGAEWRRRQGLPAQLPLACMVANLHGNKDHETLIRAWRIVLDQGGESAAPVLLLAGRRDGAARALESLAAELGLAEQVRFLGVVDDIPSLLDAADLCVFSSRSEGCPNGILEAMAAGLPVAATDIPGIRDALGEDAGNLLSPPGDAPAFAANISRMLGDVALRQRIGAANRRRIATEFSPESMCEAMVRIMVEGLNDGGAGT